MPKLQWRRVYVTQGAGRRNLPPVCRSRGRVEVPDRPLLDVPEPRVEVDAEVQGPQNGVFPNNANGNGFEVDEKCTGQPNTGSLPTQDLLSSFGDKLSNFQIPFNFFIPFMGIGLTAFCAGFLQSVMSNPSLACFSPEELLNFQFPVQTAVFLAVFLQAVAGWGFALGAITGVALLGPGLTVRDAQAFVAIVAVIVDSGMFLPYLKTKFLERKVVDPWVVGAMLGTPLGVLALRYVDEKQALFGLGLTTLAYCTYSAYTIIECYHGEMTAAKNSSNGARNGSKPTACKLPPDKYPPLGTWASGALAGILGGAFDAPGPPLVMFADLTGMANVPDLMKANLLAFFAIDSQLVAISDLLDNRFAEPFIWPSVVLAIPTSLAGYAIGKWSSRFVDQEKFRWVVLGLLAGCGLHQMGLI